MRDFLSAAEYERIIDFANTFGITLKEIDLYSEFRFKKRFEKLTESEGVEIKNWLMRIENERTQKTYRLPI